jgi:hypothetical protein
MGRCEPPERDVASAESQGSAKPHTRAMTASRPPTGATSDSLCSSLDATTIRQLLVRREISSVELVEAACEESRESRVRTTDNSSAASRYASRV